MTLTALMFHLVIWMLEGYRYPNPLPFSIIICSFSRVLVPEAIQSHWLSLGNSICIPSPLWSQIPDRNCDWHHWGALCCWKGELRWGWTKLLGLLHVCCKFFSMKTILCKFKQLTYLLKYLRHLTHIPQVWSFERHQCHISWDCIGLCICLLPSYSEWPHSVS